MTRRKYDLRRRSLAVLVTLVFASLLALPTAYAQNISGEYQVEVRGTVHSVDQEPAERQLNSTTTLKVAQQGDFIKIEFGSFASVMSATLFEGRVGNGRLVEQGAAHAHARRPGANPIAGVRGVDPTRGHQAQAG